MNIAELDSNWQELLAFLPENWISLGHETGALKGLRKDKSPEALLRTMLLHCGCGYSLRETSARAKLANLADMSDVALMKRLKKCGPWFLELCRCLLSERGINGSNLEGLDLRVFDATHVKEPGQTGSQWRVHYSIRLPDLDCDYFSIGPTRGKGASESLQNFPIAKGDHILADRAYCKGKGLEYALKRKAYVIVRLQPNVVSIVDLYGNKIKLSEEITKLKNSSQIGEWEVGIKIKGSDEIVYGRICAMLKSDSSAVRSRKKSLRRANKNGHKIQKDTLLYSNYIILFTTFEKEHSSPDILNYYRLRWQIELVFKRFKQVANFGHLPKYDEESSKSWLYGKLFVALLIEKLIAYGSAISPWSIFSEADAEDKEFLERIFLYASCVERSDSAIAINNDNAFELA